MSKIHIVDDVIIENTQKEVEIVCELCQDTGKMDNYYYDRDSNNHYRDGEVKCFCQYGEIITD